MSLVSNEMTPADIAAVTGGNNNNSWEGNGAWWLIVLFLFAIMGGAGFGNGGNNGVVPMLIDIYKDIKTIDAMEGSGQQQMQSYSAPMRSYTSVTTPSGNTYGYQGGMNTYRGRDSMGRFTRDTAKNDIIRMLEESMNKVTSEADREVLIRCIEQLGN